LSFPPLPDGAGFHAKPAQDPSRPWLPITQNGPRRRGDRSRDATDRSTVNQKTGRFLSCRCAIYRGYPDWCKGNQRVEQRSRCFRNKRGSSNRNSRSKAGRSLRKSGSNRRPHLQGFFGRRFVPPSTIRSRSKVDPRHHTSGRWGTELLGHRRFLPGSSQRQSSKVGQGFRRANRLRWRSARRTSGQTRRRRHPGKVDSRVDPRRHRLRRSCRRRHRQDTSCEGRCKCFSRNKVRQGRRTSPNRPHRRQRSTFPLCRRKSRHCRRNVGSPHPLRPRNNHHHGTRHLRSRSVPDHHSLRESRFPHQAQRHRL
jgi:hypothetical protein